MQLSSSPAFSAPLVCPARSLQFLPSQTLGVGKLSFLEGMVLSPWPLGTPWRVSVGGEEHVCVRETGSEARVLSSSCGRCRSGLPVVMVKVRGVCVGLCWEPSACTWPLPLPAAPLGPRAGEGDTGGLGYPRKKGPLAGVWTRAGSRECWPMLWRDDAKGPDFLFFSPLRTHCR